LRYGQFLGEEFESGKGGHAPDGAEAHDDNEPATQQDALSASDDHGQEGSGSPSRFGNADDVLAEFGHTHDHAEAATLLDPETRKILKAALGEMWQAELHLRLGEPRQALPYENRALDYIKRVQQSTRIYLARVGLELPPVDESRRLSGDRGRLRDPRGALVAATRENRILGEIYRALSTGEAIHLDAFETWLRAHADAVPDALALIAASDALRRQPDCADCRQQLLDRLWSTLPSPVTATRLRAPADDEGRHYLEALDEETQR
jgi:hypothetical protein